MPDGRETAMLWGALVADAAAMGLHWLYDQERIAAAAGQTPEFEAPDAARYAGTKGVFVHSMKRAGDLSHYGEQLRTMLDALGHDQGRYDKLTYERAIVARFGYGGRFHGYIDRPTRATLDNLGKVDPDDPADVAAFHGADDSQIPALAKLPALVAAHVGDPALDCLVESAVRVTNHNDDAVAFGRVAGRMLETALTGGDGGAAIEVGAGRNVEAVIEAGRAVASPPIRAAIDEVLARRHEDTAAVTRHFALHCQLTAAFPSLVHNLATAPDYTTAVRHNILAGGDSCGRAILLGAILGAVHGIGESAGGVPEHWIDRLNERAALAGSIEAALASR